jgi:hypothetical protein
MKSTTINIVLHIIFFGLPSFIFLDGLNQDTNKTVGMVFFILTLCIHLGRIDSEIEKLKK